jgi:hypothetical protein
VHRHAEQTVRDERARDSERTAFVAWGVAIAFGLWTRLAAPPHAGDVVLALYLAVVRVGLWMQAVRLRFASASPLFTPALATILTSVFLIALLLGIAILRAADVSDRDAVALL